jgi:hypothetical protein
MKLRIRGNSLRIRVSQKELEQIAERGFTSDSVQFSATAKLGYRVEVSQGSELAADFSGSEIAVSLPESELSRWLRPEAVSVSGQQPLDGGEVLTILVEKDFTCLAPRDSEDESDLFPNPARSTN